LNETYGDPERTPEELLLWFHHLPWDYELSSGRILWDEIALRYQAGVDTVRAMQLTWDSLWGHIDEERWTQTRDFLGIQEKEARWWRDSSLLYFQTFSGMPIPDGVGRAPKTLEYYKGLRFPYAPGI
jgi:alpha-glucuronidase